jgi:hypothetical protein
MPSHCERGRTGWWCGVVCAILGLLAAWPAHAQEVWNPTAVEFIASADHNTRLPNGDEAVTHYVLDLFLAGEEKSFLTIDLGKPPPGDDRVIRSEFVQLVSVSEWPPHPGGYEAAVRAVGPLGDGRSDRSNRFKFLAPESCTFGVAPLTILVRTPAEEHGLLGEYFDNGDLTSLVTKRIDEVVDFEWGLALPLADMSPDHEFSVRWRGTLEAPASETFTFYAASDDGARLWIGDELIVDTWNDEGPVEDRGSVSLTAGERYAIRLEFRERGEGAMARLLWSSRSTYKEIIPATRLFPPEPEPPAPGAEAPGDGLLGEYFSGGDFTALAAVRVDSQVDFDWGPSAPLDALNRDDFSVRWTGVLKAPATETVTFYVASDDGARLWIGDEPVIDTWNDYGFIEDRGSVTLTAGELYAVRLEVRERGGDAMARLLWSSRSMAMSPVPTSQMFSLSAVASPGQAADVAVASAPGCVWTATSAADWLTISPDTRTGPGVARLIIDVNPPTEGRSTQVLVAGQPVRVFQGR